MTHDDHCAGIKAIVALCQSFTFSVISTSQASGLPVPLPVEPRTHADRYGLTNATGKGFYELAGNPRTRVSSAVG